MTTNKAPRLKKYYNVEVVPTLMKELDDTNPMQVPRLEKIVVSMGLGKALSNPKIIESAVAELGKITGQKAVVTKSKKAIATYKLREGQAIGAMVTLRGNKMWEFLDRFVNIALPRVRDFRGLAKGFDGRGNFSVGIKEQSIFPEIDYDKVDEVRGMNICIVTTARNDSDGIKLLEQLHVPFRK